MPARQNTHVFVRSGAMDWTYGIIVARVGDDFIATARDLPEVRTRAKSAERAREMAAKAVDAAIVHRLETGKGLEAPSPVEEGEAPVDLPLQTAMKATLHQAWRRSGLTKSEVARLMGVHENEVRRILNPRHGSRLGAIEAAAKAVGARLSVNLSLPT